MIEIERFDFLTRVNKPSRYTGGELYETVKDGGSSFNVAIAFPETYDVGMSNLGLQILYSALNSRDGIWAQRAFMPLPDMEKEMTGRGVPLYGLESGTPLKEFDLVGFSLQYELTFTNVLHMLSLSGIPSRSSDRTENDPVVIAGGPSAVNPEPLADFIDAFFIGDGEEGFTEICSVLMEKKGAPRAERIVALSKVEGVYLPSLGKSRPVRKRTLDDLGRFPFPVRPLVPGHEVIHDRYSYELSRGCSFGCRFCEAGYTYRPTRNRKPGDAMESFRAAAETLGYDEYSLLSLNTGEYPGIDRLLQRVNSFAGAKNIEVSLPSLRVASIDRGLLASFGGKKKMAFTIAPEAGSERLRNVINKKLSDGEIIEAADTLFSFGWSSIKLYFMIGLPTETDDDIRAIASLANEIALAGKRRGIKRLGITVSTSSFVPKPFTPFQWEKMNTKEELQRKQEFLKKALKPPVTYKWHGVNSSLLEAVFSRGDRRLCGVLETAHSLGCRLDGWTEHFRYDLWEEAFSKHGLSIEGLLGEQFSPEKPLPWDMIDIGVGAPFFASEREKAYRGETTETCGDGACLNCGTIKKVCAMLDAGTADEGPETQPEPEKKLPEPKWYRAVFSRTAPSHLIGHLDFVRSLTKAFRRAGISVIYSDGFHPFPKIEIQSPLPLGVEADAEMMDIHARAEDGISIMEPLNAALPPGVKITDIWEKSSADKPLSAYTVHLYEMELKNMPGPEKSEALGRAEEFFKSDSFIVKTEKKGEIKETDLRKKVLSHETEGSRITVEMLNGGLNKLLEVIGGKEEAYRIKARRKGVRVG